jgi:hypothetical protein
MLCTNTSALSTMRIRASSGARFFRSSTTLFLLRLVFMKSDAIPGFLDRPE